MGWCFSNSLVRYRSCLDELGTGERSSTAAWLGRPSLAVVLLSLWFSCSAGPAGAGNRPPVAPTEASAVSPATGEAERAASTSPDQQSSGAVEATPFEQAARAPEAVTEGGVQPSESAAEVAHEELPVVLTVELAPEVVFANTERVGSSLELLELAEQQRRAGAVAAVVYAPAGVSSPLSVSGVQATLASAGYPRVVVSQRAAPQEVSMLAAPLRVLDESLPGAVAEEEGAEAPQVSTGLVLKTVGLHVGGGAHSEASRQRWVRVFERHFDEFARCHEYAAKHSYNASFGVDVYVPAAGGKPGVGEVRTKLRGAKFRRCMLRAFRNIDFPPPELGRRTAVSYSVLFKPPQ